ncbi:MAG: DUF2202 domain-containing protein [Tepidimonas sp.]
MKKTLSRCASCVVVALFALVGCGGGDDPAPQAGSPVVVNTDGTTSFDSRNLATTLSTIPAQALSDAGAASLTFMRQEEKLAQDVYTVLDRTWGTQLAVFRNTAASEATHTKAVRQLLVRYALPDPTAGFPTGAFADARLQALYADLTVQGAGSLIAALQVGALIEALTIGRRAAGGPSA